MASRIKFWSGDVTIGATDNWWCVNNVSGQNHQTMGTICKAGAGASTPPEIDSGLSIDNPMSYKFEETKTIYNLVVSGQGRHNNLDGYFGLVKRVHTFDADGNSTGFTDTSLFKSAKFDFPAIRVFFIHNMTLNGGTGFTINAGEEIIPMFNSAVRASTNLYNTDWQLI